MKITSTKASTTVIELDNSTTVLFSYKTPVAAFVYGVGWVKTDKFHSSTTSKHINAFLREEASHHAQVRTWSQSDLDSLVSGL